MISRGNNFILCSLTLLLSCGFRTSSAQLDQLNVRLADGQSAQEGRVEMLFNGTWGTVCDDQWDAHEAAVVCRSLGYPHVQTSLVHFGEGSGEILLDDLSCDGDEPALWECPGVVWGVHNCDHSEDVGVACSDTEISREVRVRLVNGFFASEGRVEVTDGDAWGTVCDDSWDLPDAAVVCRSLGYPSAISASIQFGEGSGKIYLDEVDCEGSEDSLSDCAHSGWGINDCSHGEDAGVVCLNPALHGAVDVRLSNGVASNEGRVEVLLNGQWGTVCDDDWDLLDATVVCRFLGYHSAVSASGWAQFGAGTGEIFLDNVDCTGNETSLTACAHSGWGTHNCNHNEDAGVMCSEERREDPSRTDFFPEAIDVRLSEDQQASAGGLVEVQLELENDTWGGVCGDGWDLLDATVVCRYLGHRSAVSAPVQLGEASGEVFLGGVSCRGDEADLGNCSHRGWGSSDGCDRGARAGVVCSTALRTNDDVLIQIGSVRLVGGTLSSEGRVEVYLPDQWGTVCDDNWGLRDATVVCRQLGYLSVASEHAKFGKGSGSILVDEARCSGQEEHLADCPHAGWGRHDCSHLEDVGVVCSNSSTDNGTFIFPEDETFYRLFGGASPHEGAVQVRSTANETWNAVCLQGLGPNFFHTAGLGLCRLLGYSVYCGQETVARAGGAIGLDIFPLKEGRVSCVQSREGGVQCSLDTDATHSPICRTDEAIWLACDTDLELQLAHGYYDNIGVLQVRCNYSQQWQGVCGQTWIYSTQAYQVACRHLGFPNTTHGSAYEVPLRSLSTSMNILLDDVSCSGEEEDLLECWIQQTGSQTCLYYAGLECSEEGGALELKLVDAQDEASGYLLGRHGLTDQWGAICRDDWDDRDTQVACRHLGFETSVPVMIMPARGGADGAPNSTFLSAVGCHGYENNLSECELVSDVDQTCDDVFPYVECVAETARFNDMAYLCGKKHYCGYECNPDRHDAGTASKPGECHCDELCRFFGDCCYDYALNCDPVSDWTGVRLGGASVEHYACAWVPTNISYEHSRFALVSSCPNGWSDAAVRQNCERVTTLADDVIDMLPVFDEEGAVYRNVFCAVCHGVVPGSLQHWVAAIEYIPTGSGGYTYDARFNVSVQGEPTGRYLFAPPAGVGSNGTARSCPLKTVRACLEGFHNTSLEAACKEYYAPLEASGTMFHNPHCAMCNGLTVDPTATCGPLCRPCGFFESNWQECISTCNFYPNFPSIEVSFNFGWGGADSSPCRHGELFDPFRDTCRSVVCVSGVTDEDGDCIIEYLSPPDLPSYGWYSPLGSNCTEFVNTSLGADVIYWQAVPSIGRQGLGIQKEEFSLSVLTTSPVPTAAAMCRKYKRVVGYCNITSVTVYTLEGANLLSGIAGCAPSTAIASDVFNTSQTTNESALNFNVFKTCTWSQHNLNGTGNVSVPTKCLEVLSLNCTGIELINADKYFLNNGFLVLAIKRPVKEEKLGAGRFVLFPDGLAAICSPRHQTDPSAFALGVVSLVCSCLSLVALAATFATYCAFPELRNKAGVYIMNLVAALFTAILLTVLSWGLDFNGYVCAASASLVHWSWISAFFWMAVLSYNAARIFTRGLILHRQTGAFWRRLLTTMGSVWGAALLIVSVCLVLNFCDCTGLPPVYSESQPCLISGADARLVVFGIPVASSIIVSTVCFGFVVASVRKTKRDSQILQKRGRTEEVLDELKIYAKLVLLFGTTWTLAFLSDVINHVVFSYINVTVNTLQGVFIFVAFCMNQRVRALWKRKLAG